MTVKEEKAVRNVAVDGSPLVTAEQDILASLEFLVGRLPDAPRVLIGCSYSASLALRVAGVSARGAVDAVVAFSPAEVFGSEGMTDTWVRDSVAELAAPVLILSARAEEDDWRAIFEAIPSSSKRSFSGEERGQHGMRALYEKMPESEAYWRELEAFLHASVPAAAGSEQEDAQ